MPPEEQDHAVHESKAFAAARKTLDGGELEKARDTLVALLTASPSLRAEFFADPDQAVGSHLPSFKNWDSGLDPSRLGFNWFGKRARVLRVCRRLYRARLGRAVLEEIAKKVKDQKLSATINTEAIYEEYFAPAVRASQRSFDWTIRLSIAAFVMGCLMIAAGVAVALHPVEGVNATVLSGIFGGGGAISALGGLYATVLRGMSGATTEHARLRVVLTGFATELGQLRGCVENISTDGVPKTLTDITEITKVNQSINNLMKDAIGLMPSESKQARDGPRGRTRTTEPKPPK
jgi:hypothetical protein